MKRINMAKWSDICSLLCRSPTGQSVQCLQLCDKCMTVAYSCTNMQTHSQNTHTLSQKNSYICRAFISESSLLSNDWMWYQREQARSPPHHILSGCLSLLLPSTPAGACVHPEGFPRAVSRGWNLSRCRPTCFCAYVPEALAPEAPGIVPGRGPTTAPSATDLPNAQW